MQSDWLRPQWDAPDSVLALMSTRRGGVSQAPFDSLNLALPALAVGAAGGDVSGDVNDGAGVGGTADRRPDGDSAEHVAENRRRFAAALGAEPVYLQQVHGNRVVTLGRSALEPGAARWTADASISCEPGVGCVVLVADCLPVLFCTRDGRAVGAAHAGWRGLAAGVLQRTVASLCALAGCEAQSVQAWLGPCIGPRRFEVGADVLAAFRAGLDEVAFDAMFRPCRRRDGSAGWLADLPQLARHVLHAAGVPQVHGGQWCTVEDPLRFFSFRRDGLTGRLAAAVALAR